MTTFFILTIHSVCRKLQYSNFGLQNILFMIFKIDLPVKFFWVSKLFSNSWVFSVEKPHMLWAMKLSQLQIDLPVEFFWVSKLKDAKVVWRCDEHCLIFLTFLWILAKVGYSVLKCHISFELWKSFCFRKTYLLNFLSL